MTSQELETTLLAEQFYDAMRGFIVIEESGLPKYIEFQTEEQIDVILLSGLLSGLQALAEVVSEERIKTIETSNSTFIFELRSNYFYVIWIEKTISDLELYEPIIMKIISRFEGANPSDISGALLISNLTDTPDYEKFGQRLMKMKGRETRYIDAYKDLHSEDGSGATVEKIINQFSGIDGLMAISDFGEIHHSEFPRGAPIFDVQILANFLTGLRRSIKNLDPGTLEQVTTQNYRFIIRDGKEFFYVFEVFKGLVNEEKLSFTIKRIISRYEGIRRSNVSDLKILEDFEDVPEHELMGQLSLKVRELQHKETETKDGGLDRLTTKVSFGDDSSKWKKEQKQFNAFLDTFEEVFMVGLVCFNNSFFVIRKSKDINDWMDTANNLKIEKLQMLLKYKDPNEIVRLSQEKKEFRLMKLSEHAVLFSVFDTENAAAERYMLRLANILKKISENITT
ncbi:MAG: hypothetical protein ACTSPK_03180 [Candidatus Heimdallarchaeota archaeon]